MVKKKNNILIILLVILSIVLIVIGGFLTYDKYIATTNNGKEEEKENKDDKEEEQEEQEEDINKPNPINIKDYLVDSSLWESYEELPEMTDGCKDAESISFSIGDKSDGDYVYVYSLIYSRSKGEKRNEECGTTTDYVNYLYTNSTDQEVSFKIEGNVANFSFKDSNDKLTTGKFIFNKDEIVVVIDSSEDDKIPTKEFKLHKIILD